MAIIVFTFAFGFDAKTIAIHSNRVLLNSLKPPTFGFAVFRSNRYSSFA